MDPARWRQVRELMERVLERPPEQRATYLDEACAGDVTLHGEVESLVKALDDAGSFIERPAVDLGAPEAPPPFARVAPGTSLGRFVVLAGIGEGGMGHVYAAYDPQLDRRVALKLLRTRIDISESELQDRLRREAQALARLSHPNVIAVYDVGSVDGRVFIAMEFVAGETLRKWLAGGRRRWPDVLQVFTQAGRGLEAAHAAGLVHRDFKPGNVIVGKDRVVVVDFGLARAHGDGAHTDPEAALPAGFESPPLDLTLTHTGTLIGTPAYMAPEQRERGTTSAATDQFSFCVALYEALYGERPFADDDVRTPREPPSGAGVPAWLHRILARGLHPDPAQRHPTMGALLGALSRDPGAASRRWLAAAGLVIAAAAGLFALRAATQRTAALCAGADARLAGVWDDPRRAAIDAAFAGSGAPFADDARRRVRAALDAYARRWVGMRTETCEATHVRGEQSAELLDRRMACLDERLDELGAVAEQLTHADAARVESAVKAALGLPPLSRCADSSALMVLVRPPADEATRAKVEEVRKEVAHARTAEELGEYGRGLEVAGRAVQSAETLAYWPLTAEALLRLGALQEAKMQPDLAAGTLNRALLAAQAGRHDRVAVEAFARLVRVEGSLKSSREAGHRYAAHARALLEQLRERSDLEALLDMNVGKLWFEQADYTQALEQYTRAYELRRTALGADHPLVAESLSLLGHVFLARGERQAALAKFEQALAVNEASLGAAHPRTASALDETGRVRYLLGDHKGALERHRLALARLEAAVGPDHLLVATVLVNLGNASNALGDPPAALRAHARARQILERTLGPRHPRVALALISIGNAHTAAHQERQALEPYRRALELQQAAYGRDHPAVASTLYNLGETHNALHDYAKALEYHRAALAIWDGAFDKDYHLKAYGLTGAGEALNGLGRAAEARPLLERALTIGERSMEPRVFALTQFSLAQSLVESGGSRERALDLARRAEAALRQAGPAEDVHRARVAAWLKRVG